MRQDPSRSFRTSFGLPILDFGLRERNRMNEKSWFLVLNSSSDNLKSKIQNLKWGGIVAIAVTFAMCGAVAEAQQPKKVPRVGYLAAVSASADAPRLEAFRQGLRNLGYVEGQNIIIEYRHEGGGFERLPDLAAELVRLKIDVLVAVTTNAALAAKKTTGTITIVFMGVTDPVTAGLIDSLARPGGHR